MIQQSNLTLKALDSFICIGANCPSSCCTVPWRIDVSQTVIGKWQSLPESHLKSSLLSHLRAPEASPGELSQSGFMLIDMGPEHRCPHLTGNGLCSVQVELGEDHMPDTCRTYPRTTSTSVLGGTSVKSGLLSCPEIARLVMFGQEDRDPFHSEEIPITQTGPANEAVYLHGIIARMLQAQLKDRSSPLNVRLYVMGQLLVDIALLAQANKVSDANLLRLHSSHAPRLSAVSSKIRNNQIPRRQVNSGSFWRAVYIFAYDKGILAQPASQIEADIQDLMTRPAPGEKEFISIYQQVVRLRKAALGILRKPENQGALERYLRTEFVNKGFPNNPIAGNYIATYLNVFVPFAVVLMRLWLRHATCHEITSNDFVEAVYITQQRLGQGKTLIQYMNDHPELLRIDQSLDVFADSC